MITVYLLINGQEMLLVTLEILYHLLFANALKHVLNQELIFHNNIMSPSLVKLNVEEDAIMYQEEVQVYYNINS